MSAPLPPPMPPKPQQGVLPPAYNNNTNNPLSGGRGPGRGNHAGRTSNNNNYGAPGRGRDTNNYSGGRGGRGRDGGRGGRNYPPNNNQNITNTINPDDPFEVPYGYLPAYLPGAASMVEQLDRRLLVILRDGRHLVGVLRTFDQFSNMVLQDTCERRILVVQKDKKSDDDNKTTAAAAAGTQPSTSNTICYQTDIELGLFVVRGDNVVLLGEAEDDNEEEEGNGQIRFVSLEEFEQLEDEEARRKEESGTVEEEPINWDFDMDLVA